MAEPEVWVVECRQRGCGNRVELPSVNDRIDLSAMQGWTFMTDSGWLCPQHNPSAQEPK